MKRATIDDMELGNLMFGNSRGAYAVEPREDYQEAFQDFLHEHGWDSHAVRDDGEYEYENDVFIVRPYYWGEDEEKAELPNFVFKPLGLEIRWYKYPMRGAYSNMDVPLDVFEAIMKVCAFSMDGERRGNDGEDGGQG